MAPRRNERSAFRVQAVADIEVAIDLGVERAGPERDREALQIGGLRREQREPEALAKPARKADMIRVIMRDDEPRQLSPRERPGCERLPNILRALVRDTGIENRPAVSILDEIDVDMVQPEWQRHAQPQNAGCDPRKGAVG